jgi:RNA polymerase-binding transcription factor
MNVERYKQRLQELEARLLGRTQRARGEARDQPRDSPGDPGDLSVVDELQSEEFTEGELDAAVLQQVRDALQRIDAGTFGRCVVDDAPIEEKRLEAVPWTPYCLKHQRLLEAVSRPRPTL